ncbi:MAG TPA: hypothetical protein VKK79_01575, partial [Candidatus Lokiarchaeia archaeon]|nr:hypothetical protein [Candidatus Lokiarchaeia archaeon]
NTGSYVLIGTIIGVVAAIIVIFLLIRKGFIKITRARPLYETNPVTLMGRVNALATTGRMAEAMAYLLYKYLDSLRFTMQMKKKPGQTVREVATEAVRRKLHQAEILYPWTSFVESAIYSGRRVSQSDLIKSKEYFEVANSVFPFAEHAPVPPAATGLPAEVPISVDQVPPEPSGEDNNAENA